MVLRPFGATGESGVFNYEEGDRVSDGILVYECNARHAGSVEGHMVRGGALQLREHPTEEELWCSQSAYMPALETACECAGRMAD